MNTWNGFWSGRGNHCFEMQIIVQVIVVYNRVVISQIEHNIRGTVNDSLIDPKLKYSRYKHYFQLTFVIDHFLFFDHCFVS